ARLSFVKIGESAGAGDLLSGRSYVFTDAFPLIGAGYYRLKQTYFDGTYSYGPQVFINYKAPLIIDLASFSVAKITGSKAIIEWETNKETDSRTFEVERSSDAVNFSRIGTLTAAGNSTVTKPYSLIDDRPVTGDGYYRLKLTDKDGEVAYSVTRLINFPEFAPTAIGNLVLFPNPATDYVETQIRDVAVEVTISSMSGKILKSKNFGKGEVLGMTVSDLNTGLYILRVKRISDNVVLGSGKFFKN
ncbi:MAG: T9SS type A sorting domain-containing protein, partial [Pedobacter sp.]